MAWPTLAHSKLRLRPRLSAAKTMKRKQATNFTCFRVSKKFVPSVPMRDDVQLRKPQWRRGKICCCLDPCSGRSGARSSSVTDRNVNINPGKTKGMEFVGSYNCVNSSHLLANHQADRDQSSVAVAGNGPHLLHENPTGCVTDKPPLHFELVRHILDFALDVGVSAREATNQSQPIYAPASRG